MNQKEIDWQLFFAKIFKEKSINRLHYETNITSQPLLHNLRELSHLSSLIKIALARIAGLIEVSEGQANRGQ